MTDFGQLWVWRDPALSRSLGWYAAVAANQKPEKFRIAATIPVSLGLEDFSELALWEELDRLTPRFLSRWGDVRDERAGLPSQAENGSLLDLCRELAWRMLGHCNFCRWDCRVDRREGTKLGACKLGSATRVSSHFHHPGEELVYRGLDGSGTIFFTSCNMRCAFCQNGDISTDKDNGALTDARTLATIGLAAAHGGMSQHQLGRRRSDHPFAYHRRRHGSPGRGFHADPADMSRALATKSDRMHWFDRRPEAAIFDGAFNVPMLWNSNFFMTPETTDCGVVKGLTLKHLTPPFATTRRSCRRVARTERAMADEQHVTLLRRSVREWNRWRAENPQVTPDLAGAGLRGLDLRGANLSGAKLKGADLRGGVLSGCSFIGAEFAAANLFKAALDSADLDRADLRGARFLDCAQLTAARNWHRAHRDFALECGAPIPPHPK